MIGKQWGSAVGQRAFAMALVLASGGAASAPSIARPFGHFSRPPASRGDFIYAVRSGDRLVNLAAAYLTGPSAMRAVERINHVTAERRLPIGKPLLIPRALLRDAPSEASIASFSGEVILRHGGIAAPVALGVQAGEGTEVATGRNAFATLRLADGTLVALPSNTSVRLTRLRRVLIDGAIERTIAIVNGRVRAAVVPMHDPHSSFEVTTPLSVSAVRGTHFGVAYAADGTAAAATSVEEGGVALGAGSGPGAGPDLFVAAGFGVASTAAGSSGVIALLAAPALVDPERAQTADQLHFALTPVAGAALYRVAVARDAGAFAVLDEATRDGVAGPADFTLPAQPAGSYFLRVSAIDGHGIEGRSDIFAFERRRNTIAGAAKGDARQFRFDWQATADGAPRFHFRLVRKAAGAGSGTGVVIADEAGLTAPSVTLSALPPGDYFWAVSSTIYAGGRAIEEWAAPQTVHVYAVH